VAKRGRRKRERAWGRRLKAEPDSTDPLDPVRMRHSTHRLAPGSRSVPNGSAAHPRASGNSDRRHSTPSELLASAPSPRRGRCCPQRAPDSTRRRRTVESEAPQT
jgi:hypothetical protein